jgi:hypothetical protein
VAERLRRLTRNQIPSGSVGSNPTDREDRFEPCLSLPRSEGNMYLAVDARMGFNLLLRKTKYNFTLDRNNQNFLFSGKYIFFDF